MSFQPFLVGDYRAGLQTNVEPWKLPGDAFQLAENMDMKDGVISRRLGYRKLVSMRHRHGTISGISLPSGSEVVVTTHGDHGLAVGDTVEFQSVGGTTELNGNAYRLNGVTATTLTLQGTDGDNFTAFTSGGSVYKHSTNPIMGLMLYRESDDDETLLIADTEAVGVYSPANDRVDELKITIGSISGISGVTITVTAHGLSNGDRIFIDGITADATTMSNFNDHVYIIENVTANTFDLKGETDDGGTWSTGGTVYLLNHFTSSSTDYFSWVNYRDGTTPTLWFINGASRLHKYNGTTLSRVDVDFTAATATSNTLTGGKHIFMQKERLIILSTIEGGNNLKQRARYSKPGDGNTWHDQNSGGRGGFIDCPTGDPIVSAAQLGDEIIVFFRRSTWRLRYTGNAALPFRWERINNTRKAEAPYGSVQFDRYVTGVGTTGLLAANESSVSRFDMAIPDFAVAMNAGLLDNTIGYKFEEEERVWITYGEADDDTVNKALIYHFEDGGFTTYNFVTEVPIEGISEANPGVVTTDGDHGLQNGDLVYISDVEGMTEVNGNYYTVAGKTDTTFQLEGVNTSSGYTTYTGGGVVRISQPINLLGEFLGSEDDVAWQDVDEAWEEYPRPWVTGAFVIGAAVPIMGDVAGTVWELQRGGADRAQTVSNAITGLDYTSKLRTKRLNPFTEQGVNAELGYVDILFSHDSNATVDIQFFLDSSGEAYTIDETQTLTYDLSRDRGSDSRIWKRVYPNATGAWHEMELTTTGQDVYVDIHAMIFWMRPAGRLELHA